MAVNAKARKIKNALNLYYFAPLDDTFDASNGYATFPEENFMRIGRYITNVSNDTDENVEEVAYLDGDGTEESEVISVKMGYTYEGEYLNDDAFMKHCRDVETLNGVDRKGVFKVVLMEDDGTGHKPSLTYIGPSTLSSIKTTGGDASAYEEFGVSITFDRKPEKIDHSEDPIPDPEPEE